MSSQPSAQLLLASTDPKVRRLTYFLEVIKIAPATSALTMKAVRGIEKMLKGKELFYFPIFEFNLDVVRNYKYKDNEISFKKISDYAIDLHNTINNKIPKNISSKFYNELELKNISSNYKRLPYIELKNNFNQLYKEILPIKSAELQEIGNLEQFLSNVIDAVKPPTYKLFYKCAFCMRYANSINRCHHHTKEKTSLFAGISAWDKLKKEINNIDNELYQSANNFFLKNHSHAENIILEDKRSIISITEAAKDFLLPEVNELILSLGKFETIEEFSSAWHYSSTIDDQIGHEMVILTPKFSAVMLLEHIIEFNAKLIAETNAFKAIRTRKDAGVKRLPKHQVSPLQIINTLFLFSSGVPKENIAPIVELNASQVLKIFKEEINDDFMENLIDRVKRSRPIKDVLFMLLDKKSHKEISSHLNVDKKFINAVEVLEDTVLFTATMHEYGILNGRNKEKKANLIQKALLEKGVYSLDGGQYIQFKSSKNKMVASPAVSPAQDSGSGATTPKAAPVKSVVKKIAQPKPVTPTKEISETKNEVAAETVAPVVSNNKSPAKQIPARAKQPASRAKSHKKLINKRKTKR